MRGEKSVAPAALARVLRSGCGATRTARYGQRSSAEAALYPGMPMSMYHLQRASEGGGGGGRSGAAAAQRRHPAPAPGHSARPRAHARDMNPPLRTQSNAN